MGLESYFTIIAGLFGAIAGSFLNAFLFRFNTGLSITKGRSRCMRCGHTLSSLDLVPVLSYLFLRGRCRYCRARISLQYPMVELLAAALSVAVYLATGGGFFYMLWFFVWMTLLFIVVYDLRHMVIPWSASITLTVLSLVLLFAGAGVFTLPSVWQLLAGPLCAFPLALMCLFSRGRAMGWGDAVLMVPLGWLLGMTAGFTALMFAFWSGALVGVLMMLFQYSGWKASTKRLTMKSEVPFAPFIVLGAAIAYFLHVDLFSSAYLLFQ